MQLSVTQENLARALNNVARVASAKSGLAILGNILLRTDNNRLVVAATNLEIAVTYELGAKVEKQGSITVPSRLVSEFVSNLPKGPIELKVTDDQLKLTSGNYSSTINGVVADEFPELPTIDDKTSVTYQLSPSDFKQAVSQVIITTSSDTTRPVLTGVFWHSVDGWLYLAATDGYRLSERRFVETKSDLAAIIPATTLQEVLRTLSDEVEAVEVLFDDTQVRFRVGSAEITSRLIDGNYPPYRELIPKTNATIITVARSEFSRIVKISGLFARDSGGSVVITADSDTQLLSMHSVASELGENTSSTDAKIDGDGTVTLNSRYLNEALSVVDDETVRFSFNGKLAPCMLTANIDDPDYRHIIMPLKS